MNLILPQFANITENSVSLIGMGSVEEPKDAGDALSSGPSLVTIGGYLILEPK